MKSLLGLAVCFYLGTQSTQSANIQSSLLTLSRSARQSLPSCDAQICKDCRDSCVGCNKCPLCSILAKTCAEGKKTLKFEGVDVCAKCKYCKDGKDECKRQCQIGKTQPTCQHCINNCQSRKK